MQRHGTCNRRFGFSLFLMTGGLFALCAHAFPDPIRPHDTKDDKVVLQEEPPQPLASERLPPHSPLYYIPSRMHAVIWFRNFSDKLSFVEHPRLWEEDPGLRACRDILSHYAQAFPFGGEGVHHMLARQEGLFSLPGLRDLLGGDAAVALRLKDGGLSECNWMIAAKVPESLLAEVARLASVPEGSSCATWVLGPVQASARLMDDRILLVGDSEVTLQEAQSSFAGKNGIVTDPFFSRTGWSERQDVQGGAWFDYTSVHQSFPLLEQWIAMDSVPGNVGANILRPIQALNASAHLFQLQGRTLVITGTFRVNAEKLQPRLRKYYAMEAAPPVTLPALPDSVATYRPWLVSFRDFWDTLLQSQTEDIRKAMEEEAEQFEEFLDGVKFYDEFLASIGPEVSCVIAKQPDVIDGVKPEFPLPAVAFMFELSDPELLRIAILKSVRRAMEDMRKDTQARNEKLPFRLVEEPLGGRILYRVPLDPNANYMGAGLDPAFYFTDTLLVVSTSATFAREVASVVVGKGVALAGTDRYRSAMGDPGRALSTGLYIDVARVRSLLGSLGRIVIATDSTLQEEDRQAKMDAFVRWLQVAGLFESFGSSTIRGPDTYISTQRILFSRFSGAQASHAAQPQTATPAP